MRKMNQTNWSKMTFFLLLMVVGSVLAIIAANIFDQNTQLQNQEKQQQCPTGKIVTISQNLLCLQDGQLFDFKLTAPPWYAFVISIFGWLSILSPVLYILIRN